MAPAFVPVAKAMILCDDVVSDPKKEKVHLMGVFNAIRPRGDPPFPHRQPEFSIYLQLTDAQGKAPGQIVVRQADSDLLVFISPEHPIELVDRLQVKWVRFQLLNCLFPQPGLYWVEFVFGGRIVCEQRLHLLR